MRQLVIGLCGVALLLVGCTRVSPNISHKQEVAKNPRFYADYVHLERDMMKVYEQLPQQKWKGVIAIARGGLYPGLFLAHKLELRHIETLSLASYGKDEKQKELRALQMFDFKNKNAGQGWLVIDDLVDSGKTLAWVRKRLPKAHYVTIYVKPKGKHFVDTYAKEVSQDTWIEFPWEKDFSFAKMKCVEVS